MTAPEIQFATAQGSRPYQEDRGLHVPIALADVALGRGDLLGVFDGHGGEKTADLAASETPRLFSESLRRHAGAIEAALAALFAELDRLTGSFESGSTASMVYVPAETEQAYVAVLGDSPVAIGAGREPLFIAPAHNVRSNAQERAAAEARGGCVRNGYLELPERPDRGVQMSRTFGDAALARVLNRAPDIWRVPLSSPALILVASDGLLSQSPPAAEQLASFIDWLRQGADARLLVADALRRKTDDNVTVLLWRSGS